MGLSPSPPTRMGLRHPPERIPFPAAALIPGRPGQMVNTPRAPRHYAITANVAGLTGSKLLALLTAMQLQAAHLGVFTETRTTSSPETLLAREPGAGAIAGSWRLFHTPGNGHTGGVVIAIAATSNLASFTVWPQLNGAQRVLRLDGVLEGQPASIIGVYAPAETSERRRFYASTLPHFFFFFFSECYITDANTKHPLPAPRSPHHRRG